MPPDSPQILFVSLLLAHLLADFMLQRDRDVAAKEQPLVFARHILIVTGLSWLLAGEWLNLWIPLVIAVTHGIFDAGKVWAIKQGWNAAKLFFWDQLGHLAVIASLALFVGASPEYCNSLARWFGPSYAPALILAAGLVATVFAGGIVIGIATAGFTREIANEARQYPDRRIGLAKGGQFIGWLERALIFFFVLLGKPEGVAFLVAAKSVFRFGELNKDSRKDAEYILIGTLMSFSWGLFAAWLTHYWLTAS